MSDNAEQIIARHISGALRDILFPTAPSTPIDELPYEAYTTAAIVAAECVAELEGAGELAALVPSECGPQYALPVAGSTA